MNSNPKEREDALALRAGRLCLGFFSSLGLICVILFFLFMITWLGTLAQIDLGIHEVQKLYFDSFLVWHPLGNVAIPLPGAYLLLCLLFVNILVGGIIRLRKSSSTIGVLIIHLGIVFLLVAGFVKFYHSTEGAIRFHEGQQAADFVSYYDWELVISEIQGDDEVIEHIIPATALLELGSEARLVVKDDALPFEIKLSALQRNTVPLAENSERHRGQRVVDGYFLEERPLDREAERNLAGLYLDVAEPSGTSHEAILWGFQAAPATVRTGGGGVFTLDLRKKVHPLGWNLRLDEFQKTDHPGTTMPADFRSFVTVHGDTEQRIEISMNEPLRYKGFILYQSQYSEPDSASGGRYYSILAVVSNPSDQWPLYACVVIASGLLLHFTRKLFRFARSQSARISA